GVSPLDHRAAFPSAMYKLAPGLSEKSLQSTGRTRQIFQRRNCEPQPAHEAMPRGAAHSTYWKCTLKEPVQRGYPPPFPQADTAEARRDYRARETYLVMELGH